MKKVRKIGGVDTSSNTDPNHWVIHGRKFDLTDFVKKHPGGTRAIGFGRGRDCTELFESYHPHGEKQWSILRKY